MKEKNNFYLPLYERFKPVAIHATQLQRFYNVKESDVSKISASWLKFKSFILSPFQKIATEHFDYIICGCDCIGSMMIARDLTSKGYRVLIYPSSPTQDGEKLNKIIQSQAELFGDVIYDFFEDYLNKKITSIQEVVMSLYNSCSIKDIDGNDLVLITDGTQYSANDHWSSTFNGFCELIDLKSPKINYLGLWDIPNFYMKKLINKAHEENAKINVEDNCLITFENIILTTRSSYGINERIKLNKIYKFGDASFEIQKRKSFNLEDRLEDLENIKKWLKTIKNKVNHER